MRRVNIYGVGVDQISAASAVDWVDQMVIAGNRARIVTLNTTGLMVAEQDPFFARYVENAQLVVADGQPLVWASSLAGQPLVGRVPGIDLVGELAARAADRGWSIYLLGAENATVEAAAKVLERRHPGLKVAGYHHGFLGDQTAEMAAEIAASGATLLFVGMGSPRQEQFIDQCWDDLGVTIAIGVGGTFEVLAGHLRRAPSWLQRIGLEWTFRMLQEPTRLCRRYAATLLWLARRTPRAAYNRLGPNKSSAPT